jgi:hypothetical protein
MGIDLSRIASSALEAALDDGEQDSNKHKGGSGALKAVAAGAALAVAAKAVSSKTPWVVKKLIPTPNLDGLRDIPDRVRDRLADAGWLDDEQDIEADDLVPDEPLAEGDEDVEDEEAEEPEAEGDEDFDEDEGDDDEDLDEEPEAESDEDFDEDEDEDEGEGDDEDEDEFDEEDADQSDTPALDLLLDSDQDDVDPADRPPKPPRSKAGSRR